MVLARGAQAALDEPHRIRARFPFFLIKGVPRFLQTPDGREILPGGVVKFLV